MSAQLPPDWTAAVLDAATDCYLRLGVTKTTAADIARAAGISRATLYRRFGNQEAIFLAVLERESEAMVVEGRAHLGALPDPGDRLIESIMFSIGQIRRRPVHTAIFTGEAAAWAARRAIRMEALRRIGERGLRMLVSTVANPVPDRMALSDEQLADLADWILRILISYAAVPGPGDREPAEIRRQLVTWFIPAVRPSLRP
jgi:AcrR family transcriptional regulator